MPIYMKIDGVKGDVSADAADADSFSFDQRVTETGGNRLYVGNLTMNSSTSSDGGRVYTNSDIAFWGDLAEPAELSLTGAGDGDERLDFVTPLQHSAIYFDDVLIL